MKDLREILWIPKSYIVAGMILIIIGLLFVYFHYNTIGHGLMIGAILLMGFSPWKRNYEKNKKSESKD